MPLVPLRKLRIFCRFLFSKMVELKKIVLLYSKLKFEIFLKRFLVNLKSLLFSSRLKAGI